MDPNFLIDKYCSCLFKVQARQSPRRTSPRRGPYNPYAVCQSSIFHRRGLPGIGLYKCHYDIEYLESLPYRILYDYALAKELIDDEEYDRDELIDIIADFLDSE